jgi:adenylate cyclase
VAGTYTVAELDRVLVKGKTLPTPVFTVLHHADAAALAAHQAFVEMKYAGKLSPDDPVFQTLSQMIPELAAYYAIVRSDVSGTEG